MSLISANASSVTPKNVGTISASRRAMKRSMARHPPTVSPADALVARGLLGQFGVVEVVMRGGVHLVALDLLAQRIEADRVRDGDPRRFFLEDQLRLFVQLRAVGLL